MGSPTRPDFGRRAALLGAAAAAAGLATPAAATESFADLPACKNEAKRGDWNLIAFAGIYALRQQTSDWASFGLAVEDELDRHVMVDVGRGVKEKLISDPVFAAKAMEKVVFELRSGGETRQFETDLQRLLAFKEFRFANVDYGEDAIPNAELTDWLHRRAESDADFEFAILVGAEGLEVGANRIPMDGFAAARAEAQAWSARLSVEAREVKCDPTKKAVCSAMNDAYGFGRFRNAVWLRYSERLTPEHERGYHALALPMIAYAYGDGSRRWAPARRALRAALEHMARERTADVWAEMRGGRRRRLGRLYRAVLEPLCWALGRVLGRAPGRAPGGAPPRGR